jgi:hypothetical protein
MAGTLNVDTLKADSNLRLQIASANVAFINATGMNIVGGNLIVGGTTITSAQLSQLNANGTISAGAIASVNANTITSGTIPTTQLPRIPGANMPTGSVLQVVQTTMTTTAQLSGSAWNEVTALATTITPTSATSRILIMPSIDYSVGVGYRSGFKIVRNSTDILLADVSSSRTRASQLGRFFDSANQMVEQGNRIYLDSPATTSAVTYRFYLSAETDTGGTIYVNRTVADADGASHFRGTSTIILMEIST